MSTVYKQVKQAEDLILGGTMLAIDPSSGSKDSTMGYAFFDQAEMVESGIIKIDHKKPIHERLVEIHDFLFDKFIQPDVLVIEKIRGSRSHPYLFWSVGVAVAASRPSFLIEMNAATWHRVAGTDYIKSDQTDAEMIGLTAINMAQGEDNG